MVENKRGYWWLRSENGQKRKKRGGSEEFVWVSGSVRAFSEEGEKSLLRFFWKSEGLWNSQKNSSELVFCQKDSSEKLSLFCDSSEKVTSCSEILLNSSENGWQKSQTRFWLYLWGTKKNLQRRIRKIGLHLQIQSADSQAKKGFALPKNHLRQWVFQLWLGRLNA